MDKSFGERLPGFKSLPTFLQWESVQPRLCIDAELRSQVCGMASSYHRTSFLNSFASHARYSQKWSYHWMITPRMEFISVNCKPDIFHLTTNEFSCKTSKRHQSLFCYFTKLLCDGTEFMDKNKTSLVTSCLLSVWPTWLLMWVTHWSLWGNRLLAMLHTWTD